MTVPETGNFDWGHDEKMASDFMFQTFASIGETLPDISPK